MAIYFWTLFFNVLAVEGFFEESPGLKSAHEYDSVVFSWVYEVTIDDYFTIQKFAKSEGNSESLVLKQELGLYQEGAKFAGRVDYTKEDYNRSIEMKNVTVSDAGYYRFSFEEAILGYEEDDSQLFVYQEPSWPSIIEPMCVVEGTTENLQCNDSSNSVPTELQQNITVEYTWQLDGVDIDPSSPPVNHRLESSGNGVNNLLLIDDIRRNHSGSYTCRSEETGSGLTSDTSLSVSLSVTYTAGECNATKSVYYLEQHQSIVVDVTCTNEDHPNGDGIWTVPYQDKPINTGASRQLTTGDNDMDGTYFFHVENCDGVWGNTTFKVIVEPSTTSASSSQTPAQSTSWPPTTSDDTVTLTHTTITTFTTDSVESTSSGQRPSESSWNDLFLIPILVVVVLVLGLLLVVVYRRCCKDDSTEQEYKAGGGRLVQSPRRRDTAVRYALSRNGTAYYTNDAYSGYRI